MKIRKALLLLLCITLISLLFSCEADKKSSSLRIQIEKSSIIRGAKTISPEKQELEVTSYRFTAEESGSKTISERHSSSSVCTLDGLYPGRWTVKAYGLNQAGKDISYGFTETDLVPGSNTVTIILTELVGTGGINITLKWPEKAAENPSLEVELKDGDGENVEISTPSVGAKATSALITKYNLKAGSYTMTAKLLDGGRQIGGTTEVIRVSNGTTTIGEVDILYKNQSLPPEDQSADAGLSYSDQTSAPLNGKIIGLGTRISTSQNYTATLVIANENVQREQLDISWYLDGKIKDGEKDDTLTFRVTEDGQHTLTATFQTEAKGSLGSAKVSFLASSNTNEGAPNSMYIINAENGLSIDGEIVAKFLPNGDIIISSNAARKVYAIPNGSYSYEEATQSATYEELGIQASVSDFAVGGKAGDEAFPLFFFSNSPASISVVNYTSSGSSLSKLYTYPTIKAKDKSTSITSFGSADGYYDDTLGYSIIGVSASTSNKANKGLIFFKGVIPSSDDISEIELANEVSGNMFGEGDIRSVQAVKRSQTFSAVSKGEMVVYNVTKLSDRPAIQAVRLRFPGESTSFLKDGVTGIILKSTTTNDGYGFLLDKGEMLVIDESNSTYVSGEFVSSPGSERKVTYLRANKDLSHIYALTSDGVVHSFTATKDGGQTFGKPGVDGIAQLNSRDDAMLLPQGTTFNTLEIAEDKKALIAYKKGGNADCVVYITLN